VRTQKQSKLFCSAVASNVLSW